MGEVISRLKLGQRLAQDRRAGRRIVFTNGCFDVLHAGHVMLLAKAKRRGDVLLVGLNSDASVRRLKGGGRPVVPARDRAAVLAALGCVDYVTFFDEDTPLNLIRSVVPDVLVKGGDYRLNEIVGADVVRAAGGRVIRIRLLPGRSSSAILRKIRAL